MSLNRHEIARRVLRSLGPHFGQPRGVRGYAAGLVMLRSNSAMVARLLAGLAPLDGLDVLDVGCGPATALTIAHAAAPRSLTGIDASIEMIHLARLRTRRARRTTPTNLTVGSAHALPLPTASIDAAWAINTIHHWPDAHAGIADITRVVRPGGRVLLAERYGPPAHRHRPCGATDATIAHIIDTATAAGLTHTATTIVETAGDRAAAIHFTHTSVAARADESTQAGT